VGIHLKRAIFLDRDGTLNAEFYYADTGAFESPRTPDEFMLLPGVPDALLQLQKAGFLLFIVSNQPNAAKGKVSMETLAAIHNEMLRQLGAAGIGITQSYYCYHHPDFTGPCECRKPSPYFLLKAAKKYDLDLSQSWIRH